MRTKSTEEKQKTSEPNPGAVLLAQLLLAMPENTKLELIDFGPPIGRELPL